MPAIIAAVKLAQIAVVVTGSVIALTQAPVILVNLAGFTAAGVKAGSIAAATQSAVYGGLTTGLFAGLQSFGATAAVSIPALAGGLASAAAGVAAMVAV